MPKQSQREEASGVKSHFGFLPARAGYPMMRLRELSRPSVVAVLENVSPDEGLSGGGVRLTPSCHRVAPKVSAGEISRHALDGVSARCRISSGVHASGARRGEGEAVDGVHRQVRMIEIVIRVGISHNIDIGPG